MGEATQQTKTYTAEDFYRFGQQNLKHSDIAAYYETSNIRISQVLKDNPKLRDAMKRGKNGMAFDADLSLASVILKDSPEPIAESNQLAASIKEAIGRKLFFLPDIAQYLGVDRPTAYNAISNLVSSGEIVRHDTENGAAYQFPDASTAETNASGQVENKSLSQDEINKKIEDEINEKILAAIDDLHCTLPQIKSHAGFEKSFDISLYIENLLGEDVITKLDNGNAVAYFRLQNAPVRFWLDGGKCAAEFPAENQKKPVRSAAGKILSQKPQRFEIKPRVEQPPVISELESESSLADEAAENVKSGSNREQKQGAINWTTEYIEELAEKYFSYYKAAKSLNCDPSSVRYQVLKTSDNEEAWNRGQQKFLDNKKNPDPLPIAPADLKIAKEFCDSAPPSVDDPDAIANFLKFRENARKADLIDVPKYPGFANCSGCDKPFNSFPKHIGREEAFCDECLKSQEVLKVEVSPRFEHTLEHIAQNGHSRQSIEKVQAKLLNVPAFDSYELINQIDAYQNSEITKEIQLSDGVMRLETPGNFFDMPRRDRNFLNAMADLIQEYEGEK